MEIIVMRSLKFGFVVAELRMSSMHPGDLQFKAMQPPPMWFTHQLLIMSFVKSLKPIKVNVSSVSMLS
jgi:hypothetical protein